MNQDPDDRDWVVDRPRLTIHYVFAQQMPNDDGFDWVSSEILVVAICV